MFSFLVITNFEVVDIFPGAALKTPPMHMRLIIKILVPQTRQ